MSCVNVLDMSCVNVLCWTCHVLKPLKRVGIFICLFFYLSLSLFVIHNNFLF